MNDLQTSVWNKLQSFSFNDGPADLTFQQRLARENGWSMSFAERVVEEYKRFVFLARFAGHPVTPSDEVDQCWHLHLTYTRSYWNDLCSSVLGQPLHHDPTRGGRSEDAKFDDWYAKTKSSYEQFFAAPPPEDVWPPASQRFDPRQRFKRVDASEVYLLPRRSLRRTAMISGATLLGVIATGCTAAATGSGVPVAFLVAFGVFMVVLVTALIIRATRGGQRQGCSAGATGCSTPWFFWGGGDTSDSGDTPNVGSSDSGSSDSSSSGCGSSGCGGGGCGGGD